MVMNEWGKTVADLRHEIKRIESTARGLSTKLVAFRKVIQGLKPEYLQLALEEQIQFEARARGIGLITRDKRKLRDSLLVAAGGFILGSLVSKDGLTALNMGVSGFDGTIQGFGQAKWYFSLGKRIVVASGDSPPAQGKWVSWESLKGALTRLRGRAQRGEDLGNIDNVILLTNTELDSNGPSKAAEH